MEDRRLLAANIQLVDAYLIDGKMDRITTPVLGERLGVRADFRTTDLPSNAQYHVDYVIDGVRLSSDVIDFGTGRSQGSYHWYRTGWYATLDQHSVEVIVDGGNTVAESNEADNIRSFTIHPESGTPPTKFAWPIEGIPFKAMTSVS